MIVAPSFWGRHASTPQTFHLGRAKRSQAKLTPVTETPKSSHLDFATLIAVGLVVYLIKNVVHGYGFVLTTALATLGGTAWLAWFLPFVVDKPGASASELPLGIPRSKSWLVAGFTSALITVFVLGPSIPL